MHGPQGVARRLAWIALALGACAAPRQDDAPPAPGAPALDAAAYDAWRAWLAPRAEEERWRSIPWRASFAAGQKDALAAGKPLLLWGMNGHPLGAT